MATPSQKETIAIAHINGASVTDLATCYGYTYGGMAGLLKTDAMQDLMASVNSQLMHKAVQEKAKVLLQLGELLDTSMAVALDPAHRDSSKDRWSLIEMCIPKVSTTQPTSIIDHIPSELVEETTTLLRNINKQLESAPVRDIKQSPHLLEGQLALPDPNQSRSDT